MLQNVNISNIRNSVTRSFLRGLLDKTLNANKGAKLLNSLIRSIAPEDAKNVEALLYRSPLYSHLRLKDEFSPDNPFAEPSLELSQLDDRVALVFLSQRMAYNEERLSDCLELFAQLNDAICQLDASRVQKLIDEIVIVGGLSFLLLRKLSSAKVIFSANDKDTDFININLNKFGLSNRNISTVLTVDTIGFEYDYISLRKAVSPTLKSKDLTRQLWQRVADWLMNPVCRSKKEFFAYLHTHNQVSLLDGTYYYLSQKYHLSKIDNIKVDEINLPLSIEKSWNNLVRSAEAFTSPSSDVDSHHDFMIYRGSTAWLENIVACKIRALGDNFYQRLDVERIPAPNLSKYVNTQLDALEEFIQIAGPVESWIRDKRVAASSGHFIRSIAFFYLLEQGATLRSVDPLSFIDLMAKTRDLARLADQNVLRELVSENNHIIVNLIIYSLLIAESSKTFDHYCFKETFQNVINECFGGEILEFLRYLHANGGEVVNYYLSVLDEHMLSQLPYLIESGDSVYQIRADILDWHAVAFDDLNSKERSKQLRLDRKIQKARGKIHEARLNVDSQRFVDWISDNILQRIVLSIRDGELAYKSYTDYVALSSTKSGMATAHRDPVYSGITAINDIFFEFCTNNSFGVASYLGRRIRHGTMKGTLISGLTELRNDSAYKRIFSDSSTADEFDIWYKNYCFKVDSLVKSMYFYEKTNTNGIISATIDNKFKYDIASTCLNILAKQFQIDGHFSNLPKIIESYCWLLLGPELEKINLMSPQWRMKWGVFDFDCKSANGSLSHNRFSTHVNRITDNNFKVFASWFKTPSSLHPEAEISEILSVVMLEAYDEFAEFRPPIVRTGDHEYKLIGAVYYHVYDGLAIAVKNVAKHGKRDGKLAVHIDVTNLKGVEILEILITSAVTEDANPETIKSQVKSKLALGPVSADVIEGGSGLRKLAKMVSEAKLLEWDYDVKDGQFLVKLRFIVSGVLVA